MKQVDMRYKWFYKFYNNLARFEINKLLSVSCTGCQVAHRNRYVRCSFAIYRSSCGFKVYTLSRLVVG